MFDQAIKTMTECKAVGSHFEPSGVIRLDVWTMRYDGDSLVGYDVAQFPIAITDEIRINPATLKIVPADDPSGVPAFTYAYNLLAPIMKPLAEGFVQANMESLQ